MMNTHHISTHGRLHLFLTIALTALILLTGCATTIPVQHPGVARTPALPDLSGLAWIEGDLFLAVHDTKGDTETEILPRISLVRLPQEKNEGPTWQSLDLKFPGPGGPSRDLESVSRIPGGRGFLLAESGQAGEDARRIFFAQYRKGTLTIESYAPWPVPVENVEATEVCQVGRQLVFLYAERAEGLPSTKLRWAKLSLNPLAFGTFKEVTYKAEDPIGMNARPIVALAVDNAGFIYSASAYDSGNDDGPFRSVVWRIGKIIADKEGNPQVELGEGKRLATLDGLKVESIAVRETEEGGRQIYVGTDDENYGGIIRLLPRVP